MGLRGSLDSERLWILHHFLCFGTLEFWADELFSQYLVQGRVGIPDKRGGRERGSRARRAVGRIPATSAAWKPIPVIRGWCPRTPRGAVAVFQSRSKTRRFIQLLQLLGRNGFEPQILADCFGWICSPIQVNPDRGYFNLWVDPGWSPGASTAKGPQPTLVNNIFNLESPLFCIIWNQTVLKNKTLCHVLNQWSRFAIKGVKVRTVPTWVTGARKNWEHNWIGGGKYDMLSWGPKCPGAALQYRMWRLP